MAIGAAIVGVVQGARAAKEAKRGRQAAALAGVTAEEQKKATTAEEIRRQKYTFERDTASIEAAMAAGGLSDPKLRKDAGTPTGYEGELATAKSELATFKKAGLTGVLKEGGIKPVESNIDTGGWGSNRRDFMRGAMLKSRELTDEKEGKIAELQLKHDTEMATPWSKEGGMFAQYMRERQDVQEKEIQWMERTGLSAVKSIQANTQSAIRTARGQEMQAYGDMASSFATMGQKAGWWK